MKNCDTCKEEKDLNDFNKNRAKKDGFNSICRQCSNKRSKQYYKDNTQHHKSVITKRNSKIRKRHKAMVDELKFTGCSICDEKEICCLDYHHLRDKENAIAVMVASGVSWSKILEEISKCILVCANCHRKIHAGLLKI